MSAYRGRLAVAISTAALLAAGACVDFDRLGEDYCANHPCEDVADSGTSDGGAVDGGGVDGGAVDGGADAGPSFAGELVAAPGGIDHPSAEGTETIFGLAVDGGHFVIAGSFTENSPWGADGASGQPPDVFIHSRWDDTTFASTGNEEGRAVALIGDTAWLVGEFVGTATVNGNSFVGPAGQAGFVLTIPEGRAAAYGGTNSGAFVSVVPDPDAPGGAALLGTYKGDYLDPVNGVKVRDSPGLAALLQYVRPDAGPRVDGAIPMFCTAGSSFNPAGAILQTGESRFIYGTLHAPQGEGCGVIKSLGSGNAPSPKLLAVWNPSLDSMTGTVWDGPVGGRWLGAYPTSMAYTFVLVYEEEGSNAFAEIWVAPDGGGIPPSPISTSSSVVIESTYLHPTTNRLWLAGSFSDNAAVCGRPLVGSGTVDGFVVECPSFASMMPGRFATWRGAGKQVIKRIAVDTVSNQVWAVGEVEGVTLLNSPDGGTIDATSQDVLVVRYPH